MKFRSFTVLLFLLLSLGSVALLSHHAHGQLRPVLANASPPVVSTPPNVLLVLTDDLDYNSVEFMRTVKTRLAANGTSFSRHFVTNSLCCPSRATILRSQFVHSHGIKGNGYPNGGFRAFFESGTEQNTLATWFDGTSYRRALMGKYLNEYPRGAAPNHVPPGWDDWFSPVNDHAYAGYKYKVNDNGSLISYGKAESDYFTDVLSVRAQSFISGSIDQGKPFFLYLAPFAPHQPATPAERHRKLFQGLRMPRLPSFGERDVSDKPGFVKRMPLLAPARKKAFDSLYRRRLQSLQAVDEMIDALLNLLATRGQLSNTYIIFTSDNGFHMGHHRLRAGKKTPYDEDIRIPLIIAGPGITAGTTRDEITMELDLAPTIAAWTGISVPAFAEGRSLVPLLTASAPKPGEWRQAALVEHFVESEEPYEPSPEVPGLGSNTGPIPPYVALRLHDWLYTRYETGERELYRLSDDPFELRNLISFVPPAALTALDTWSSALSSCSGAACRTIENIPPADLAGWLTVLESFPPRRAARAD